MLLNRRKPHSRGWLRSRTECNQVAKANFVAAWGTVGHCDEFPYASTVQGGRVNYARGRVSLALAPARETPIQGGNLSAFYRICRIKRAPSSASVQTASRIAPKSRFLAVGLKSGFAPFVCVR